MLIRSGWSLVVGMAVTLATTPWIIKALIWPVDRVLHKHRDLIERVVGGHVTSARQLIIADESLQAIKIWLTVGFWAGLILAAPAIIYHICGFVFPGLLEKERKAVKMGMFASSFLFFGGVALGYWFSLPFFIRVNFAIADWIGVTVPWMKGSEYMMTVIKVLLAFGLSFELPVVVFMLGYLGIVDSADLRKFRRHVAVGILVLAMFLTPPDVGTQIVLAVPLYILYEITINLVWLKERKDLKERGEEVGGWKDVLQSLAILAIPLAMIGGLTLYRTFGPGGAKDEGGQIAQVDLEQHLGLVLGDASRLLGGVDSPETAGAARLRSYGLNGVLRDLMFDYRMQAKDRRETLRAAVTKDAAALDTAIGDLLDQEAIAAELAPTLLSLRKEIRDLVPTEEELAAPPGPEPGPAPPEPAAVRGTNGVEEATADPGTNDTGKIPGPAVPSP